MRVLRLGKEYLPNLVFDPHQAWPTATQISF